MKRNMDIIRLLLLQLEGDDDAIEQLKNYSEKETAYNAALAVEAGLIEGEVLYTGVGKSEILAVDMDRLSWQGHDFLDAARDETLWKKAKQTVMKPAASFTFDLVKEWLKAEVRSRFGFGNSGS